MKRMYGLGTRVCVLFVILGWGTAMADATLVENGQGRAAIVLARNPSKAAEAGARELQSWIEKVSGATLPVLTERETIDRKSRCEIFIGQTNAVTAQGVTTEGLGPEGIRIKTVGKNLFILGVDRQSLPNGGEQALNGTFYAVMTFVEDYLGVRWLWPGELGTVVPQEKTITVPKIDYSFTPRMKMRRYRNTNVWSGVHNRKLSGGVETPDPEGIGARMHGQAALWLIRHKLSATINPIRPFDAPRLQDLPPAPGGSVFLQYGHAFKKWYETYGEAHPEWFALQPDGSRKQPGNPGRARFCLSNEELIEEIVRQGRKSLDENPRITNVNLCPNDGGSAVFCVCERCKALDVPGTDLTARYMWFFNRIAEGIAETHPDRYVCSYAYSRYKMPQPDLKMYHNVILGMVMFGSKSWLCDAGRAQSRAQWQSWTGKVKHRFLRPNISSMGGGLPLLYPHRMDQDLKWVAQEDIVGFDFANVGHHWANEGLDYYVLAKLIWNPEADVDEIIDDYCRSGFGKAAPTVKRYFQAVEAITSEIAKVVVLDKLKPMRRPWTADYCKKIYAARLPQLKQMLLEAKDAARAGSLAVRERVDFLGDGLRFAELTMTLDKRDRQSRKARQAYYEAHRFSWAVAPAYKGGGVTALREVVVGIPSQVTAKVKQVPILWKNSGKPKEIKAFGYRAIDDMHVFLVLFETTDALDEKVSLYIDADMDTSTGRKRLGNDHYIAVSKRRGESYDANGQYVGFDVDFAGAQDRALIVGVKRSKLKFSPLGVKFKLWISTPYGKTGRFIADTANPSGVHRLR